MNNKDLISQYVDSGLRIPEYQMVQLPNWAKKTYIRKRIIATNSQGRNLDSYEFNLFDDKGKWGYFVNIEKTNGVIPLDFLDETPEYLIHKVIKLYIDKEHVISGFVETLFDLAPLELKIEWLEVEIYKNRKIKQEWVSLMPTEILYKFINQDIKNYLKYNVWLNLTGSIYKNLSIELKTKIIDAHIKSGRSYISNQHIWHTTPVNLQKHFVRNLAVGDYNIEPDFYDELSDEIKFEYLTHLIPHLKKIRGGNWDTYLSDARHDDYSRLKNIYDK